MSLLVVGGGLAGLSAVAEAQSRGVPALLLDPGELGGVAVTRRPRDGWAYENGPTTFTSRSPALVTLVERLGLRGDIVRLGPASKRRFLRRGGALRANLGALTWGERFTLLRGLFVAVDDDAEASVRTWVAARFGAAFADEVVSAMLTGIWAADAAEIEMVSAFPKLFAAARGRSLLAAFRRMHDPAPLPSGTWSVAGGLGRIGATAAARFGNAHQRRRARALRADPAGGWVVETDGEAIRADRVILATPAPAAAELLAPVAARAAAEVAAVRYTPIVAAHWLAAECAFPTGFGYLAGPREGAAVLGSLFTGDLFPDRCPPGLRAGVTLVGGSRDPGAVGLDDTAVRERVEAEHLAVTGRAMRLEAIEIVRHRGAVPLPEPGHAARRARAHAALPKGLALAGAWDGAGSMECAAASGAAAVARICA